MDLAQKSDDEILAVADPIMDNLMQASTAIDHERHTRDFTEHARSVLSPSAFESTTRSTWVAKASLLRASSWQSSDGQIPSRSSGGKASP